MRFQLATLVGGSSVTIHCHAATARLTREYQSEYRRLPLTSVATCGPPLDTNVHISSVPAACIARVGTAGRPAGAAAASAPGRAGAAGGLRSKKPPPPVFGCRA